MWQFQRVRYARGDSTRIN
ncbi:hypothetical protein LINGRAHAP2_LOCUS2951 [Linum grandiflorum]